ncbi:MAG: site-2 protease family protein [Polyangiaceae bacterium]|nr:site-2 protease family protein [Polyangiaceae bacterium]
MPPARLRADLPLPMLFVLYLVPMVLSGAVHEFSHAWVAHKLGDDTPERQGRLTLSPLVHIDFFGTLLVPALSILTSGVAFLGWARPVQFVPTNFTRKVSMRTGTALVAVAGPLSNVALAFVSVMSLALLLRFAPDADRRVQALRYLAQAMFQVNVGLAVFNLLPVPPLDGSRLLPRSMDELVERAGQYSWILIMLIISIGPVRAVLLDAPMRLLTQALQAATTRLVF